MKAGARQKRPNATPAEPNEGRSQPAMKIRSVFFSKSLKTLGTKGKREQSDGTRSKHQINRSHLFFSTEMKPFFPPWKIYVFKISQTARDQRETTTIWRFSYSIRSAFITRKHCFWSFQAGSIEKKKLTPDQHPFFKQLIGFLRLSNITVNIESQFHCTKTE